MKRVRPETKERRVIRTRSISASGAKLSHIPLEVVNRVVGEFLTAEEKENLSLTGQSMFHATKHSRDELLLRKFLLCVARGEQDKAKEFLKFKHTAPSKWLLSAGEFTDYSGRTFHCTAYEYAYWAKDTYMCRMLEQYMDEATKGSVLQRIEEIERIDKTTGKAIGLTYQHQGEIQHSVHFDFTPLKQALKAYLDGYVGWEMANNEAAIHAAWMLIGKAQRDVPAHVAQEYCRLDSSFSPCPQFNAPNLPNVLTFLNWNTGLNESWFPLSDSQSGLGFTFALIRAADRGAQGLRTGLAGRKLLILCYVDLAAITRLDEVRTDDLRQSRDNLNSPAISQCKMK